MATGTLHTRQMKWPGDSSPLVPIGASLAAGHAPWQRTKRDQVEKILRALFPPSGIPPRELRNADLIRKVRLEGGLTLSAAGDKTILQAASRLAK